MKRIFLQTRYDEKGQEYTGQHPLSPLSFHPAVLSCSTATAEDPVSIGLLLPLSGPESQPIYDALTLARDQINAGGGIRGRPVQLVLRDTGNGNLTAMPGTWQTIPISGW